MYLTSPLLLAIHILYALPVQSSIYPIYVDTLYSPPPISINISAEPPLFVTNNSYDFQVSCSLVPLDIVFSFLNMVSLRSQYTSDIYLIIWHVGCMNPNNTFISTTVFVLLIVNFGRLPGNSKFSPITSHNMLYIVNAIWSLYSSVWKVEIAGAGENYILKWSTLKPNYPV